MATSESRTHVYVRTGRRAVLVSGESLSPRFLTSPSPDQGRSSDVPPGAGSTRDEACDARTSYPPPAGGASSVTVAYTGAGTSCDPFEAERAAMNLRSGGSVRLSRVFDALCSHGGER